MARSCNDDAYPDRISPSSSGVSCSRAVCMSRTSSGVRLTRSREGSAWCVAISKGSPRIRHTGPEREGGQVNQAIESGTAGQLLCQDPRCRTVLPGDAEICDECGAANLRPLAEAGALLIATYADHPVGFPLQAAGPNIIGLSGGTQAVSEVVLTSNASSDFMYHTLVAYAPPSGH